MKIINRWLQFQKNVYIDKFDDTVNKYNNIYHSTIKTKPVDVKSNTYIDSNNEIIKILNLKLVILLEYQNIKIVLKKVTLQIGLKFLWLKKLKILCRGHILLMIFRKKLLELFKKKNCKKQIKNNLELKK